MCVYFVQRLLLMGRRHEALDVALAGQLWGPALVLAHGYGEWAPTQPHLSPFSQGDVADVEGTC